MKRVGKLSPSLFSLAPKQRHGVADKEDLAGVGASGEFGGEWLAFRFVIGEADFDQPVIGECLIERGNDFVGNAVVANMDDGFELLRSGFKFAEGGFVHAENLKSE